MRKWSKRIYNIKIEYKGVESKGIDGGFTWLNVPQELVETVLRVSMNNLVRNIKVEEDEAPNMLNMSPKEYAEYLRNKGFNR